MAKYSVTRNGGGFSFAIYSGDNQRRAEEAFNCAPAEKGTVIVYTDHEAHGVDRVRRRPAEVVLDICTHCGKVIYGDDAPARDAFTQATVCPDCTLGQRRARRFAAYL